MQCKNRMIKMNAEDTQDIFSRFENWGVLDIKRIFDEKHLNVPEFQREDVWHNPEKSRLIESLLRGIPIPSIYLSEEKEGIYNVIDGQQRINSIVQYLDDSFGLSGLQIFTNLRNIRYNNLKGEYVQLAHRLHNVKIPVIIITAQSDNEIVYEIFNRLNTGGMKLNAQEVRNCMYHGNYNDLIKKLALDNNFGYLLGSSKVNLHRRMNDSELVLRFFAFNRLGKFNINKYNPPLKQFLNKEMDKHKNISDGNETETLTNIFKETVKLAREVFGINAFRKFNIGSEEDVTGKWDNKFIKGIFDVVMCGFARYVEDINEREAILQFKGAIREELIYLMLHNDDFIQAIGDRTFEQIKVRTRFNIWFNSLSQIIENKNNVFSLELKKQICDKNSECCICGKNIQNLDDAEIHNVDYYWRGETIPITARVVHRYCNRNNY